MSMLHTILKEKGVDADLLIGVLEEALEGYNQELANPPEQLEFEVMGTPIFIQDIRDDIDSYLKGLRALQEATYLTLVALKLKR